MRKGSIEKEGHNRLGKATPPGLHLMFSAQPEGRGAEMGLLTWPVLAAMRGTQGWA